MAEGGEVPIQELQGTVNVPSSVPDGLGNILQKLETASQEGIAHTPLPEQIHVDTVFPSSTDVQSLDWQHIISRVDEALSKHEAPTQEIVDTLLRRYILETLDFRDDTGYSFDPENCDYSDMQQVWHSIDELRTRYALPHFKGLPEEYDFDKDYDEPEQVAMSTLPADSNTVQITLDKEKRYYKGKLSFILHIFDRLPVSEQEQLIQELVPYLYSPVCTSDEIRQIRDALDVNMQTQEIRPDEQRARIQKPIIDELVKHNHDLQASTWAEEHVEVEKSELNPLGFNIYERMDALMNLSTDFDLFLEYTKLENFEELQSMTGLFLWPEMYPYFINDVRDALKSSEITDTQRRNLTMIGRGLLGEDPYDEHIDFFTTLNALYNEMKFENYKPNEVSTKYDANVILSVIQGMKRKNPKVFQIGVGTGRHFEQVEKMIKDWSIEDKPQLMGIDANERHIEIAKQKVSEAVKLFVGSWLDLPVDDESLDMIVSLGRDLPHAENAENFLDIFCGAYRKLKPGGIFLFDKPNPLKGLYPTASARVQKAMEIFGIKRHLAERATDFIVDGPENGKLYNRFAPAPEKVIEDVEHTGATIFADVEHFYCDELIRVPIADGHGSEDILFIAYKPEDNSRSSTDFIADMRTIMESDLPIEERIQKLTDMEKEDNNRFRPALLSMRDQILLSLSERLKGDERQSQ